MWNATGQADFPHPVAFAASAAGSVLFTVLGVVLPGALLLRLLIAGVVLCYVLYLLARSRERIGRITTLAAWAVLAGATWWMQPSLPLYLLVHVGALWLIRSLYFYSSVLSAQVDDTRLYYGNKGARAKRQAKIEATDKLHAESSVSSRARRAAFNVSKRGEPNLLGESELVDDVQSGRVDLSGVDRDELPEPMRAMAPKAQEAMSTEMAHRRGLADCVSGTGVTRSRAGTPGLITRRTVDGWHGVPGVLAP